MNMKSNMQSIYELLNYFRQYNADFTNNFCIVNGDDTASHVGANYSRGFAPAFAVG
jgi:hypothetical protein